MERGLHDRDRAGVQDCVLLEKYDSEQAFVDNLRKRFKENLIYTYIGRVLLSVNPYRPLPIYGSDAVSAYRNVHYFEAPPHIYAVADTAHRSLTGERRDQCILISGESGSGKTEASKKVLQFVAEVSRHQNGSGKESVGVVGVKDKLLQSNPLLEAFGNATTGRNDNSSRFGKYMDIAFDATGDPVGGNILNYLLEKSRVVHRTSGDRNFHVFYQLLSGADDPTLASLHLDRRVDAYAYLAQSSASAADVDSWREMRRAMQAVELSTSEQKEMFAIVASVLHLGNVMFAEDESGKAHVDTENGAPHVRTVAQLLGCCESALTCALTHRTIDARGDVVVTPLSRESAAFARDALAKAIYDRLFTWLVRRLNASLQPANDGKHRVMGILDIYGFEIFDTNSFEQFCINYCNEKLQQLFIELTLRSEQEEYEREGIEWEPVAYFDNKIICDLIEEKHKGIISIMDEECLRPGDATDASLLAKLGDRLAGHPRFVSHPTADKKVQKTMRREEFKVAHYAGEVTYTIDGFLEKNNDLLFRDLRLAMSQTTNSITRTVFPVGELSCKKRPETAVAQFKASLGQLMVILSSKEPSYIRCIKPNAYKAIGVFDERIVSHQVQYLGLMENLRVRRAGFAYRRQYDQFLARYKSLCPATWPRYKGPTSQGVRQLVQALGYAPDQYRMGNTKIFIRHAKTLFETEDALQARKHSLAASIQARWRGFVQRRLYLRQRRAAVTAQCWVRRHLARRTAQRRRAAATTIRNFIEGFITRGGPQSELNGRFHQIARRQYLTRLANSLPHSLLVNTWPVAPVVCREASLELRRLHRAWLARKFRLGLTPQQKEQLELKVLAESLFRGKRKSYSESVAGWFVRDRLTESQQQMRAQLLPYGQRLLYSSPVHKFDRHGYKRRDRVLVLSDTTLYLAVEEGGGRLRPKHRLPWRDAVVRLEVTGESDRFVLLRLSPEHQKTDKGDLILEMPNVIEFATLVVSETNDPGLLNINTVENGQITHQLSDGSEGRIDLALGQNGQAAAITKSKSGHLIVVG